mmetsp:Transcript_83077/g.258000  ORF Transcript_83077/g.258000 Transcript_83077/m.258000 type:complete len:275 (+) Transcript_83077:394-1218(+)
MPGVPAPSRVREYHGAVSGDCRGRIIRGAVPHRVRVSVPAVRVGLLPVGPKHARRRAPHDLHGRDRDGVRHTAGGERRGRGVATNGAALPRRQGRLGRERGVALRRACAGLQQRREHRPRAPLDHPRLPRAGARGVPAQARGPLRERRARPVQRGGPLHHGVPAGGVRGRPHGVPAGAVGGRRRPRGALHPEGEQPRHRRALQEGDRGPRVGPPHGPGHGGAPAPHEGAHLRHRRPAAPHAPREARLGVQQGARPRLVPLQRQRQEVVRRLPGL